MSVSEALREAQKLEKEFEASFQTSQNYFSDQAERKKVNTQEKYAAIISNPHYRKLKI